MSITLQRAFEMITGLYGPRNQIHLQRHDALLLLSNRRRELGKLIRKSETDKSTLSATLASMFARLWSYAETFGTLPIVEELAQKYPESGCAYCGHKPCRCRLGIRPEIISRPYPHTQLNWSIRQWTEHLDSVYGTNNRERGIAMAFIRLSEELDEASDVSAFDTRDRRMRIDNFKKKIAREFADAFAWIMSIAATLNVDLDAAIVERYSGECLRCKERPCQCASSFSTTERANPIGQNRSADTITG